MSHQNFEQHSNLFSLTISFEKLQISKPLDQKRDEYLRTLRSQKRKHYIHKKRMNAFSLQTFTNELDNIANIEEEDKFGEGLNLQDKIKEWTEQEYETEQLDEIINALNSNNLFKQHFGVIGLRKLLSVGYDPPIQEVIDAGAIPRLIELMQKEGQYHIQVEIAQALLHLASGTTEQAQEILDHGAIPALIKLLESSRNEVLQQAMWTLANIAAEDEKFRNIVLNAGALGPLIKVMNEYGEDKTLIQTGTRALSNLCQGKPSLPLDAIKDVVPVIARVVMTQENVEVLSDALWALSHSSEGSNSEERIQMILDTGVTPYLVKFLAQSFLVPPSVKIIGNILAGNNEQGNTVLEIPGLVENLFGVLSHKNENIRRDAVWALSNIAAGGPQQLEYILAACYIQKIYQVSLIDTLKVRREAVWVLGNAIESANLQQLGVLLERRILQHLGDVLQMGKIDQKIQEVVLQGILKILDLKAFPGGYPEEKCLLLLDENGAIDVIGRLRNSENFKISNLAKRIVGLDETLGVAEAGEGDEKNEDFQFSFT